MRDRPISYWVAIAGMGFENDFNRLFDRSGLSQAELAERLGCSPAYVSKVLSGAGNLQLKTMAKWARAIGAIVQVRLIKEGEEVVRVVDFRTAAALDAEREPAQSSALTDSNVINIASYQNRNQNKTSLNRDKQPKARMDMY